MADSFVKQVGTDFVPDKEENVYEGIFSQYEHVIIQSLITSFGLDFIVRDQHGGDVDTIHNVRQIGKDGRMTYKSNQNRDAYENRGKYNRADYKRSGTNFQKIKHSARKQFKADYKPLQDEYTGKFV